MCILYIYIVLPMNVHRSTINKTICRYVLMKEKKAGERVEDMKLVRIKIRDLPSDTVGQSAERRRDKPNAWVRIQASARFFICSGAFFPLCYSGKALQGPILTRGLHNLIMLI